MEFKIEKSRLMLKFIIASLSLLLIIPSVVFAQPTISVSAGCSPTRVELVWPELPDATDYTGYKCAGSGCAPTTSLWGNNLQPGEAVIEGGIIRYTDLLAQSGTLYRYQVYSTPGNKPSNIAEITVPACCSADMDKSCGSCGGKIKCDGSCSASTPSDFGKLCNCGECGCGGAINCQDSCSGSAPSCSEGRYTMKGGTSESDCGKTIDGKTVTCTYGGPPPRLPTITCFPGDKRIRCQDIGVGHNHGCDPSGENGCYAWEASGNKGYEGCLIECEGKVGCYTKDGIRVSSGSLTKENFGTFYPDIGITTAPAQTDADTSSGACECFITSSWNDNAKCCGDDTDDCGKISSGFVCDATASSASWTDAKSDSGAIKYVACNDAEYLSDGSGWTKCDGVFLRQSVEGNEYVCVGKGKETLIECCGDEECNSDGTDGKRITTGQSVKT